MGTRGFVGFISNGEIKGSYFQFDGYPTGTGVMLQKEIGENPDVLTQDKAKPCSRKSSTWTAKTNRTRPR